MNAAALGSILLYRYLDATAALKTIESRAFKVGRIHDFNDRFEWRVGIDPEKIIPGGEPFIRAIIQDSIATIDRWIGILSHSASVTEPVLWSHYADKHRGVAFEISHTLNPEFLVKINYTDERPILDPSRLDEANYIRGIVERLTRQKSLGWKYEQEYRVYLQLNDCDFIAGYYFTKIPGNMLKRVILGYDCPLEEDYVCRALKLHGFSEVKVVRAKMCLKTYSILV